MWRCAVRAARFGSGARRLRAPALLALALLGLHVGAQGDEVEVVNDFRSEVAPRPVPRPADAGDAHGPPAATTAAAARLCNNTEAGHWLVADSDGVVCSRANLDPSSGCCDKERGEAFACQSCDDESQCCPQYEHCVSCCLKPGNGAADAAHTAFRSRGHNYTGHWDSPFRYCAGACRTTGRATEHENAYVSPAHYCYSASGAPRAPPRLPPPPSLPQGSVALAAADGVSCADACRAEGRACAPDAADALSDCNALRDHFPCEAGCVAGAAGAAAPAYVLPSAAKAMRPAACLLLGPQGTPPACDAATAGMRRLCACVQVA